MRFDFSRFLLDIEHRFRRFRGLSLACRLLFYGSLASIIAILSLRWLIPNLDRELTLLVLLTPITMAIVAFFVGWWKRPNLPHLLMHLDDELKSGARISSLYEVRLAGQDSFFRHRLESLVETISADWKRGIKPKRRTASFLSAGLSGILVAGIILFIPLSFPQAVSMEGPEQSESSSAQMPRSTTPDIAHPTASDDAAATLQTHDEVPEAATDMSPESTQLRPNEELSLDSVLDDLSTLSRGQAQVNLPTTSDELMELADAQQQARQALSDMLRDLQEQMQGNPRPL
ncbi:hypothetical protein KAR02_15190, partial [Candidatus Bipolaricaulota bacterium]|nr:hypothetical protein [Candidatus Bipolaricaulota bacterium]